MSTRAGSGFDREESGLGPCPRRASSDCEKLAKPQGLGPYDGTSSKCLEKGYGKPSKPGRRSLLNFCKRLVRLKEKPSNCPPCPETKPEQSFWDYLFKFDDDKRVPDPATCRVAQRCREACRRTDPRLCDPRYRRTDGDVLVFTEEEKPRCPRSGELQPKSPPGYKLPKAMVSRRIAEIASSQFPVLREETETGGEGKELSCSGPPWGFRIPFEECRPPRRRREPFTCDRGTRVSNLAPPVSVTRGTCGGRSIGEYLAEATIDREKSEMAAVDTKLEPPVDTENRSRIQRLHQLTKHADNCGKDKSKISDFGKTND